MGHTRSAIRCIEARFGLLCTVPCLQWMQVANGSQRLSLDLKLHRWLSFEQIDSVTELPGM